jgi:hypothetical protein
MGIYSRSNIMRGLLERMGDTGGARRVLVGKPEGKRQLGRPTRRWEHNIKADLKE